MAFIMHLTDLVEMADLHVETMRRPNFAPFNLIGQTGTGAR
jgi:hypothetical protein